MHYPPLTPADKAWGLQVIYLGRADYEFEFDEEFVDENDVELWPTGRTLSHYQLSYVIEGQARFMSELTGETLLQPGDLFLMFPQVWHAFEPLPGRWHEFYVAFEGNQLDRLRDYQIISPHSPVYNLGSAPAILDAINEMERIASDLASASNRRLASRTSVILSDAVSHSGVYADAGAGRRPEFLSARLYLDEHQYQNVDMTELARSVGTSYPVLRRLFQAAIGLSPHKYHRHLRINRAKEMLQNPEFRIKDVARHLGFRDEFYFSRAFHKEVGCSPSEWREQ